MPARSVAKAERGNYSDTLAVSKSSWSNASSLDSSSCASSSLTSASAGLSRVWGSTGSFVRDFGMRKGDPGGLRTVSHPVLWRILGETDILPSCRSVPARSPSLTPTEYATPLMSKPEACMRRWRSAFAFSVNTIARPARRLNSRWKREAQASNTR
jgi:hypothetical protein